VRKYQKFLYAETQDLFVKYSVKDGCDVNNFNYVDVLFSILNSASRRGYVASNTP